MRARARERWGRAAPRVHRVAADVPMNHHIQVVVAYDFSPSAEQALARAIEVACRAPQHVLHVVAALDARRGFPILPTHHVDYGYATKIQDMIVEHIKGKLGGRPSQADVEFYVHA